jgi:hypothetical protein
MEGRLPSTRRADRLGVRHYSSSAARPDHSRSKSERNTGGAASRREPLWVVGTSAAFVAVVVAVAGPVQGARSPLLVFGRQTRPFPFQKRAQHRSPRREASRKWKEPLWVVGTSAAFVAVVVAVAGPVQGARRVGECGRLVFGRQTRPFPFQKRAQHRSPRREASRKWKEAPSACSCLLVRVRSRR